VITFIVNGKEHRIDTPPQRPLLEVLREDLHLTGTHYGCGEGMCRACTVLIDGRAAVSCLTPVAQAEGKSVTTIEGLSDGDKLHPVQQVFLERNAFQCGYCTGGMILSLVSLLNEKADEATILARMNANLCRCCGYDVIADAIKAAAKGGAQ
jgi:aerobic-type carbon monoxide dehydrogenase small subunit (CoxS/CutS family)